MKKIIIPCLLFLGISSNSYAQSSTATNNQNGLESRYLGYSNNFPLFFRTNATTTARNRMLISNGGFGNFGGRIAMGNNLPNNFTPTARLHLHQTGGFTNLRFTTDGTGSSANNGLEIGMANNGNATFINNELGGTFSWFNQGSGPGTLLNRMILFDGGAQAS